MGDWDCPGCGQDPEDCMCGDPYFNQDEDEGKAAENRRRVALQRAAPSRKTGGSKPKATKAGYKPGFGFTKHEGGGGRDG